MRKKGRVFYQISDSAVYNANMGALFQHGFSSRIFGFGGGTQSAVQVYRIPNTRVAVKTWVKDANAHIPGTNNHIRTATMMFEELMIDYNTWKGVVSNAQIVDDAKYAPCLNNGGYDA